MAGHIIKEIAPGGLENFSSRMPGPVAWLSAKEYNGKDDRRVQIMSKFVLFVLILGLGLAGFAAAVGKFEEDTIPTSKGDLVLTFLGHGSLMMGFGGKVIQIDPFGQVADYSQLPKADLVLITHDHYDHLDPKALQAILKPGTTVVASKVCAGKVKDAIIMNNGDSRTVLGLAIEAVPAYNIVNKRPDGNPFHPKGAGNGYIVTFGDKRVYIAGDTENTPEMKTLKNIDVAFLPMNLPYTMTPEMVADAAKTFKPRILYPYHFGETDTSKLVRLLQAEKEIEVRVRKMS
jgi:L-ascorbate metabolism protein UlaG (beta-lactamase superfamily)